MWKQVLDLVLRHLFGLVPLSYAPAPAEMPLSEMPEVDQSYDYAIYLERQDATGWVPHMIQMEGEEAYHTFDSLFRDAIAASGDVNWRKLAIMRRRFVHWEVDSDAVERIATYYQTA